MATPAPALSASCRLVWLAGYDSTDPTFNGGFYPGGGAYPATPAGLRAATAAASAASTAAPGEAAPPPMDVTTGIEVMASNPSASPLVLRGFYLTTAVGGTVTDSGSVSAVPDRSGAYLPRLLSPGQGDKFIVPLPLPGSSGTTVTNAQFEAGQCSAAPG